MCVITCVLSLSIYIYIYTYNIHTYIHIHIDTSEIVVDFPRCFCFQWMSVAFYNNISLVRGIFRRIVQLIVSGICHGKLAVCDIWCVICRPDSWPPSQPSEASTEQNASPPTSSSPGARPPSEAFALRRESRLRTSSTCSSMSWAPLNLMQHQTRKRSQRSASSLSSCSKPSSPVPA